mmetsp:Transcript_250/g.931  ORF Transcript_250/g.931 Transcript_250/m.931 type:complete len:201 (-) Transcript_250:125-727(-)
MTRGRGASRNHCRMSPSTGSCVRTAACGCGCTSGVQATSAAPAAGGGLGGSVGSASGGAGNIWRRAGASGDPCGTAPPPAHSPDRAPASPAEERARPKVSSGVASGGGPEEAERSGPWPDQSPLSAPATAAAPRPRPSSGRPSWPTSELTCEPAGDAPKRFCSRSGCCGERYIACTRSCSGEGPDRSGDCHGRCGGCCCG